METPVGDESDSQFGDFIEDERGGGAPRGASARSCARRSSTRRLHTLTHRERKIIELRFGPAGGHTHTLEEVGQTLRRHPRAHPPDRSQDARQAADLSRDPAPAGVSRLAQASRRRAQRRQWRPDGESIGAAPTTGAARLTSIGPRASSCSWMRSLCSQVPRGNHPNGQTSWQFCSRCCLSGDRRAKSLLAGLRCDATGARVGCRAPDSTPCHGPFLAAHGLRTDAESTPHVPPRTPRARPSASPVGRRRIH